MDQKFVHETAPPLLVEKAVGLKKKAVVEGRNFRQLFLLFYMGLLYSFIVTIPNYS